MSDNSITIEINKDIILGITLAIFIAALITLSVYVVFVDSDAGSDQEDEGASDDVEFDYPVGATADGIEDTEALIQSHEEYLRSNSYEIVSESNIESIENNESEESDLPPEEVEDNDLPQEGKFTYTYDQNSQQGYSTDELTSGNETTVTESFEDYSIAERFIQTETDDETEYDRMFISEGQMFTSAMEVGQIAFMSELEVSDTEESDGEEILIYEINDTNEENLQGSGMDMDVDMDGEIHLSENGYITYVDAQIENRDFGEKSKQTIDINVIDDANVEEPDWVDTAYEEADEPEEPELPEGEIPEDEIPEDEIPEDEIPEDEIPEDEYDGDDGTEEDGE